MEILDELIDATHEEANDEDEVQQLIHLHSPKRKLQKLK